jgi:hypothetical protein
MSIVKFPGGTPPPEGNDDLATREERFMDLEHEVCNLERAGKIVEHFVAGWLATRCRWMRNSRSMPLNNSANA